MQQTVWQGLDQESSLRQDHQKGIDEGEGGEILHHREGTHWDHIQVEGGTRKVGGRNSRAEAVCCGRGDRRVGRGDSQQTGHWGASHHDCSRWTPSVMKCLVDLSGSAALYPSLAVKGMVP